MTEIAAETPFRIVNPENKRLVWGYTPEPVKQSLVDAFKQGASVYPETGYVRDGELKPDSDGDVPIYTEPRNAGAYLGYIKAEFLVPAADVQLLADEGKILDALTAVLATVQPAIPPAKIEAIVAATKALAALR